MSRHRLEVPRPLQQSGQNGDMYSLYDHDPFVGLGAVNMLKMDRALNGSSHNQTNEDHESWVNSRLFKIQGVNLSESKPPPRRDFDINVNNFEAFRNQSGSPTTTVRDSNVVQSKAPNRNYSSTGQLNKPYQVKKEDSLLRVLEQADMASQQQLLAGSNKFTSNEAFPYINLGDIESDFRNLPDKDKGQIEKTVWTGTESWKTSGGQFQGSNFSSLGPIQVNLQKNRNSDQYGSPAFQNNAQNTAQFGRSTMQTPGTLKNSQQQVNFGEVGIIKIGHAIS